MAEKGGEERREEKLAPITILQSAQANPTIDLSKDINQPVLKSTMDQLIGLITTAISEAMQKRDGVAPKQPTPHPYWIQELESMKKIQLDLIKKVEDLSREMSVTKKKLAEISVQLKGEIPFGEEIMANELPPNSNTITIKYDGTTDPWEHLTTFENFMLLYRYSDGVKCRVFSKTLTKSAKQWFNDLPANSIHSFKELSDKFLNQFASWRKYEKTSLSLFDIRQEEEESLRNYVKRFNMEAMEVPSATQDTLTAAFMKGLKPGDFFRSLVKKPSKNFADLLARAEGYINIEEALEMRKGAEKRESKRLRLQLWADGSAPPRGF